MAEENENEEVRGLDQRIDEITDETLDSTRRILNVAEETNQIGVETLVTLNVQGEKLDNVERRFEEMNTDLNRADKNITELEKFCGCCVCPTIGQKNVTKTREYKRVYGKKKSSGDKKSKPVTTQPTVEETTPSGEGYIKRVTGDEREEEMEQNLQAVGNILDNLHGIAVDMGDELDRQNVQLKHINKSAAINEVRLNQTNDRLRQQLY